MLVAYRLALRIAVVVGLGLLSVGLAGSDCRAVEIARYAMNEGTGGETASSAGGSAGDATLFGDIQWVTNLLAPASGNSAALQFPSGGIDNYLLSDTLEGVTDSLPRTISAWVRTTSDGNLTIADSGTEALNSRFTFRTNNTSSQGVMGALRLEVSGGYAVANTPVNDGQWHHVAVTVPDAGSVDDIKLYVDGQLDGDASTTPFSGVLDTTIATTNGLVRIGQRVNGQFPFEGVIDEVRLWNEELSSSSIASQVPSTLPTFGFVVDAVTGNISLHNEYGSTVNEIVGYTLHSDAGNLSTANWLSVAENYDADSGSSSFDGNDTWFEITDTSQPTSSDLSEFTINGDGGSLASGGTPLNLGNVWSPLPYEAVGDITAEIIFHNGERQAIGVSYINTGTAFPQGDLDLSGDVDAADWEIFRSNLLSQFPTLTKREAYLLGDIDLDGDNDRSDFDLFEALYDTARGPGALQSLISGTAAVPEPSTWMLALLGGLLLLGASKWRSSQNLTYARINHEETKTVKRYPRSIIKTMVALLILVSTAAEVSAVELLHYWDFEGSYEDKAGLADGTAGAEVVSVTGHNGNTAAYFPAALASGEAFDATGYVDIDSTKTTNTGNAAFSFSYWFKLAVDDTTDARGIFDFSGNGGDGPQSLWIQTGTNENKLAFRVDGVGSGNALALVDLPLEDDQWHFLAATFDPTGNLEVHVDGAGVDASALATGVGTVDWSPDQYLGAFNVATVASRGMNGSLDDMAIYSGVLTSDEIAGLYTSALTPDAFLPEPIGIEVNTTTGVVKLSYSGINPIDFDYYEIVSEGSESLDVSKWSSLEDQDLTGFPAGDGSGNGWESAGGSSDAALGEVYLDGFSTFTSSTTPISLGSIFRTDMPQDLSFIYRDASGVYVEGDVTYVSTPAMAGDFNGDGMVNLADYTVWRDNLGSSDESAFAPGTGNGGGIDASDYQAWKSNFGATSGSLSAVEAANVPEPATIMVVFLAMAAFGVRRSARAVASLVLLLGCATAVQAEVTTDRLYSFGDDTSQESPGNGVTITSVADSWFDPALNGADNPSLDYEDSPMGGYGGASYTTSVAPATSPQSTARGFSNNYAADFDGTTGYFRGGFLGNPEASNASADYVLSISYGDGPLNYKGIQARGFQLWVNPDVAGGSTQTVVRDTTSHGLAIGTTGNWVMRYASTNYDSGVSAAVNDWSHVMVVAAERSGGSTAAPAFNAVMYVDGIAVTATSGTYGAANTTLEGEGGDLTVGANMDSTGNPIEFFDGSIDEMEMFVAGTSQKTTFTDFFGTDTELPRVQYGSFDPAVDNDYIAAEIATFGDITGDGAVTSADINQFMAGWLSENRVNSILVGDLNSYANGDLNFDGIVDLGDAVEFNGIAVAAGLAGLDFSQLGSTAVPEPTTLATLLLGVALSAGIRRYR
ncbi:LamG-like jellyroll fold domain-containing protein [Aeoliella mucimassa]|uniref:Laminin G domain protein n=1 Tax=Aeoliella mucimassa TaxID=2527972 RepID=A0A518AK21_9BACT|nr:LamG-like jellyroll fold domain-containing protein [Aeoliella mucimassa]QDU55080.1 Laminin G domain protein [Aeoliella mucimassa]